MKNKDLFLGLLLIVISFLLFCVTFIFPKSSMLETHTSAAFFPRTVLIIAMALISILIIKSLGKKDTPSTHKGLDRKQKIRVIGSMGIPLLFGFSAVFIGTFFSIFLMIISILLLWGVGNKITILLIALLTPLTVYLIFTKILLVQFPSGVLF